MESFDGRVAVVTGGASGIGRALAEALAAEGAQVVVADLSEDALEVVVEACARVGSPAAAVVADVGSGPSVEALAESVLASFGHVDLVFANAGVACFGSFDELTLADWDRVLNVNLVGVVRTAKAFLPKLVAAGEGHLMITGSMASFMAGRQNAAYNASKHALLAVADSLRADLAAAGHDHVGVSLLCPGPVRTGIVSGSVGLGSVTEAQTAMIEAGMAPAEVAAIALRAVRGNQRYVFTHPAEMEGALTRRDAAVRADLARGCS